MPQYTATLLLIFIFVTCFYRKHITDWWWFKFGACAFVVSVVIGELSRLLSVGRFLDMPPICWVLLDVITNGSLIASGAAFVISCIKGRQVESEHLRCLKCGYILKGLSQPRCPECGQAI